MIKGILSSSLSRRSIGHTFVTFNIYLPSSECPILVHLIDLAGTDNLEDENKMEASKGSNKRRALNFIRKSLASLGAVLHGLVKMNANLSTPMSFRESSLTRLLKRSICVESNAVIVIANVCPSSASYTNSLQTLTFASRLLRYRNHTGTSPFQRKRLSLNAELGVKLRSPEVFLNDVQESLKVEAKQSLLKTIVSDPRQRLSNILERKKNTYQTYGDRSTHSFTKDNFSGDGLQVENASKHSGNTSVDNYKVSEFLAHFF